MKRFSILAALLAAAASPLTAQTTGTPVTSATPVPPAPGQAPVKEMVVEDFVKVVLTTDKGRIVIALDRGRAPVTTANFLKYVDSHRFDGEYFYRAMKMDGSGLIQGGIATDARKQYAAIAHEPTTKTGIHHEAGTISMANGGAGTAKSDFFILTGDTPGFDADGYGSDGVGFAAFGHVVEGMDVVTAIFNAPTDPDKGVGIMKGQMLSPRIKIVKAERAK